MDWVKRRRVDGLVKVEKGRMEWVQKIRSG